MVKFADDTDLEIIWPATTVVHNVPQVEGLIVLPVKELVTYVIPIGKVSLMVHHVAAPDHILVTVRLYVTVCQL